MAMNSASSTPRPSYRRPTILVGSDVTLLGRPTVGADDAASAGLYGVDLDLRRSWRAPGDLDIERLDGVRLRSVWLPTRYTGLAMEQREERLRAFIAQAATRCGLRTVIVSTRATSENTPLNILAHQQAEAFGIRLTLEVRAETLLDERGPHLTRVANIRRFAEEWDLDIALDLGSVDLAGWETEAALMRLFPRLTLVRIGPMHGPGGHHAVTPGASVSMRTVKMLADQAYSGLISVLPAYPHPAWWSWASHPPLAAAVSARDEILAAYDRIDQYDISAHHTQPRW
jgi:hypothetical protein